MSVALTALGFDPAPGDLRAVSDLLLTARGVAAELDHLRRRLDAVGSAGSAWEGVAARAFADRVGELPGYLGDAGASAGLASRALGCWLDQLGVLKVRAQQYEQQAWAAREALRPAFCLVAEAQTGLRCALPEARAEAASVLDQAQRAAAAAEHRLAEVVAAAEALLDEHQRLADAVAAELRRAAELAPPEPGFFERVGQALDDLEEFTRSLPDRVWSFLEDHAELIKALASVAGDVATLLAIAALLFSGGALTVAAVAVGATALLGTAVADLAGADVSPLTHLGNLPFGKLGVAALGKLGRFGVPVLPPAAREWAEEALETGASAGGSVHEGDRPFEYWLPSSPGEYVLGVVNPVSLALWNAVQDGLAKDRARKSGS